MIKRERIGNLGSREDGMVGHKIIWRGWDESKELLRGKESRRLGLMDPQVEKAGLRLQGVRVH